MAVASRGGSRGLVGFALRDDDAFLEWPEDLRCESSREEVGAWVKKKGLSVFLCEWLEYLGLGGGAAFCLRGLMKPNDGESSAESDVSMMMLRWDLVRDGSGPEA